MIKKTYIKQQKGFTLIELSIVILVIGILVGGVVLGGKIVEQSKFSKFVNEFQTVSTAITIFKDTYSAYPGDFNGYGSTAQEASQTCKQVGGEENNTHAKDLTIWPNICPGDNNGLVGGTAPTADLIVADELDFSEFAFGLNHLIYEDFLPNSFSNRNDLINRDIAQASYEVLKDNEDNRLYDTKGLFGTFPKSYNGDIKWFINPGYFSSKGTYVDDFYASEDLDEAEAWVYRNVIQIFDIYPWSKLENPAKTLNTELAYKIDAKLDDGDSEAGKIRLSNRYAPKINATSYEDAAKAITGSESPDDDRTAEEQKIREAQLIYLLE
jgi:prepilin-type N-terminal cleavage/methylation domain-containing protein